MYLEEMGTLKAIAFDKTGTLTKGVPVVTDFELLNQSINEKELLSIVTVLEYCSQHPLASAIMKKADEENIPYASVIVEGFSPITGKGIKVIALLLVIPGWLTLWITIMSDMGTTLLVALNSLRLLRIKE